MLLIKCLSVGEYAMGFYELLFKFYQAKGAKNSMLTYEDYYDECVKYDLYVISSDKNTALNFPVLKDIMSFDNIKTIFKYPNLSFLNPRVVKGMRNGERAPLAVDYSISFEANTARYLHDYMRLGAEKVPKKFVDTLTFLLDNNINLDPMFYILENVAKGEDSQEFYDNLVSIKKLMTCDMEHYKSTNEIKSIYDDKKVVEDSIIEVETLKSKYKKVLETTKLSHLMMKSILLIIIIARFKHKNNMKLQLEYVLKFMNDKMKKIYLRELSIGVEYFEKKHLEFFKKINNKDKFFKAIDNMAWDFTVIRLLEMFFSSKPNPEADFFIPFIFTLDKGLLESIEMYYCKDFLIFNNEKRTDPIPYSSLVPKIKKYKLNKYFTEESVLSRINSNDVDFHKVYKELEIEVKKVLKLK